MPKQDEFFVLCLWALGSLRQLHIVRPQLHFSVQPIFIISNVKLVIGSQDLSWALHLATLFPGQSAAKLKEGIFVGTQIRKIQKCIVFDELLTSKKLRACEWEAFKSQSTVASLVMHG